MTSSLLTLIALYCAATSTLAAHDAQWETFKSAYGHEYPEEDMDSRRPYFDENVRRICDHNLRYDLGDTSYRLGLNKFAAMTEDEFQQYRGLAFNASKLIATNPLHETARANMPASVDWRTQGYVTPVKDQGQCGSCWAFSATGSLEGQHFHRKGTLVSLSEQNLVDCSTSFGNQGCNGGLMDQAFNYIKSNGGIDTESSYPYTANNGTCKYRTNSIGATCTGHVDIKSKDENALQFAVATVGPISVGIYASYNFQLYKDGVFNDPTCVQDLLNHGVLAVGYSTTEDGRDYWIVKNSWGTGWGQSGYIFMSRNKNNQCGIATQASYPTV